MTLRATLMDHAKIRVMNPQVRYHNFMAFDGGDVGVHLRDASIFINS